MRFMVKQYEDGNMFAVELTDDGSSILKALKGSREVGKRLSAFIEVLGDDTDEGASRIREALKYLDEVVSERANEPMEKTKPAPKKRR